MGIMGFWMFYSVVIAFITGIKAEIKGKDIQILSHWFNWFIFPAWFIICFIVIMIYCIIKKDFKELRRLVIYSLENLGL